MRPRLIFVFGSRCFRNFRFRFQSELILCEEVFFFMPRQRHTYQAVIGDASICASAYLVL